MTQRKEYLKEVGEWLSRLESSIDVDRALRHQDLNIELELFFRDLLNLAFGLQLKNAESATNTNQDSFDLFDDHNRIVIQVTTTTSAAKIRKTLATFIGKHDVQYNRLIFMYPSLKIGKSKANFKDLLGGYEFDAKRDRWSFAALLKRIQDMQIEEQAAVLRLLQRELKTLARPLPGFQIEDKDELDVFLKTHVADIGDSAPKPPVGLPRALPVTSDGESQSQVSSAKEVLLAGQNTELKSQLQHLAETLGIDLYERLSLALRRFDGKAAEGLHSDLRKWLDGPGRVAAAATRFAVTILVAESLLWMNSVRSPDEDKPDTGEVRTILADASSLADGDSSEDDAARLLALQARVEAVDGAAEKGLLILGDQSHPLCVRARIALNYELERLDEAIRIIKMHTLSCRWADLAIEVRGANGEIDEAKQICEWCARQEDEIAYHRCLLSLGHQQFVRALHRDDPCQLVLPTNLTDSERQRLREVLDSLRPLLEPGLSRGKPQTGIEVQAHELALRSAHLIRDLSLESKFGAILQETEPISIHAGYAIIWGCVPYARDVIDRLRKDWPGSFEANMTAASADVRSTESPSDLISHLTNLWALAVSEDNRKDVAGLVAQIAPMLNDKERTEVLDDLGTKIGTDHPEYRLVQARQALAAGRFEDAWKIHDSVDGGDAPQWRLLKADLLDKSGAADAALDELVAIIKSVPHADLLRRIAAIAWQLQRWKVVVTHLEYLIVLNPANPEPRQNLVAAYVKVGTRESIEKAIEQLAWITEHESEAPELVFNHALLLAKLARVDDALRVLNRIFSGGGTSTSHVPHGIFLPAILLKSQLMLAKGRGIAAFQFLDQPEIRDVFWSKIAFLHQYHNIAYRAKREDAGHKAMLQIRQLESGKPEVERSVQAKTTEDVKRFFEGKRRFQAELRKRIVQGRLPWAFIAMEEDRPLYLEWHLRTVDVCVVEEAETRGAMIVYATNGFSIQIRDDDRPALHNLTAAIAGRRVVIDPTALITLQKLNLIDETFSHFEMVFVPGDFLLSYTEDAVKLQPSQLSTKDSTIEARRLLDQRKIVESERISGSIIAEYAEHDDRNRYGISNVIEWLAETGQLSKTDQESLAKLAFELTTSKVSLSEAVSSGSIAVSASTLKRLIQHNLIQSVLNATPLQMATEDCIAIRQESATWDHLDVLYVGYQQLVQRCQQQASCEFVGVSIPEMEDTVREDCDDWRIEQALRSAKIAAEMEVPLLADDRVCQQVFLGERPSAELIPFSTWHLAEQFYLKQTIAIGRLCEITLQLIHWRYRFFVPSADVLLHLAIEHRDSCPGRDLTVIAIYAHDCMADPGLCCGLEPTEPRMSLSCKLYMQWGQVLTDFILAVWDSTVLSADQKTEFTDWAVNVCLPIPPVNAARDEQVNLAANSGKMIVSQLLMKLSLRDSEFTSAAMMECLQNAIGMDRLEYCKVASLVAGQWQN